jgi:hypothetical protein
MLWVEFTNRSSLALSKVMGSPNSQNIAQTNFDVIITKWSNSMTQNLARVSSHILHFRNSIQIFKNLTLKLLCLFMM